MPYLKPKTVPKKKVEEPEDDSWSVSVRTVGPVFKKPHPKDATRKPKTKK